RASGPPARQPAVTRVLSARAPTPPARQPHPRVSPPSPASCPPARQLHPRANATGVSARRHQGAHGGPVGEVVLHRAVLLDLADELLIRDVRLRSGDVHVDLHYPETRANLGIVPEKTAQVD